MLAEALLALLPTPRAAVDKDHGADGQHWGELKPTLLSLLPTPTAHERTLAPRQVHHGRQLANELRALKLLPTPVGQDGKNATAPSQEKRNAPGLPTALRLLSIGASTDPPSSDGSEPSVGLLENPCFREWLLGAPEGWSDPDCPLSATEFKSRSATSPAATSSSKSKDG
jgi:hypothetical protein